MPTESRIILSPGCDYWCIIESKYCKDGKKARSKSNGEQGCSDPLSLTASDNTWKPEITNYSVSQSADGTLSDKRHSPSPSNRCLLISRPVLPHTFCSSKQQLLFHQGLVVQRNLQTLREQTATRSDCIGRWQQCHEYSNLDRPTERWGWNRWPHTLHANSSHTWLSWEWFSPWAWVRMAWCTVPLPALQMHWDPKPASNWISQIMQSVNQTKGFYNRLRAVQLYWYSYVSNNKILLVLGAIRGDKQTGNQILMLEKKTLVWITLG